MPAIIVGIDIFDAQVVIAGVARVPGSNGDTTPLEPRDTDLVDADVVEFASVAIVGIKINACAGGTLATGAGHVQIADFNAGDVVGVDGVRCGRADRRATRAIRGHDDRGGRRAGIRCIQLKVAAERLSTLKQHPVTWLQIELVEPGDGLERISDRTIPRAVISAGAEMIVDRPSRSRERSRYNESQVGDAVEEHGGIEREKSVTRDRVAQSSSVRKGNAGKSPLL